MKKVTRLVVCQGTAQLATAVSVLEQRDKNVGDEVCFEDYLVILELATPEGQVSAFVNAIEQAARQLKVWSRIVHIDDKALRTLATAIDDEGARRNSQAVQTMLGRDRFDEIYVSREWQRGNELMLSTFANACSICYGDSAGIYLPKSFVDASPSARWKRILRETLYNSVGTRHASVRDLDAYYLLLPNAFGASIPARKVTRTEISYLRDIFSRLAPLTKTKITDEIWHSLKGHSVWTLLCSNFSEQGILSVDAEVNAYKEWVVRVKPEGSEVLFIKPHPRDNEKKAQAINDALHPYFSHVISATESNSYLPIEAMLTAFQEKGENLRVLTCSTACLGTRLVLNLPTEIGFGRDIVRKYFPRSRRKARYAHEKELARLCSTAFSNFVSGHN